MGIYILLFVCGLGVGLTLGWQITVWKIGNLVNIEKAAHEATKERFAGYRDLTTKAVNELHAEIKQLREKVDA